MKKLALILAVCSLPALAFAASPVKPGKWQMTMQTEMTGMPMKMAPITVTKCVTQEDVDNPEKFVPRRQDKNNDCKYSDVKIDGNKVSWKMSCEKSKMTGEGYMKYTSDTSEGAMHMVIPGTGEINAKYSGKYLGACDK